MAVKIYGTGSVTDSDITIAEDLIVKTGYSATLSLTDAANIAWDTSLGQVATVTLSGNRTMNAPTNLKNGAFYAIEIRQDATGSRLMSWNAVFKFSYGTAPTLSTAANARDFITFRCDGTNLYEQGRSLGVA